MKSVKGEALRGKLIIVFLLLLLFYSLPFTLHPTFAADSTPSGDIAAKLKEFQKEAASKAAQLKELISKKLQNKAFVGNIESLSSTSLTLATDLGPRMVSINEDTEYESNIKSRQKFSDKTMKAGDYIATLGDADETGVLTARKIVLEASSSAQPKTYLWGQVISVSDELITIRDKEFKNTAVSLPKTEKVKLSDILILTGSLDKNNIFTAGYVYTVSESGLIKPKKTATPSAGIN